MSLSQIHDVTVIKCKYSELRLIILKETIIMRLWQLLCSLIIHWRRDCSILFISLLFCLHFFNLDMLQRQVSSTCLVYEHLSAFVSRPGFIWVVNSTSCVVIVLLLSTFDLSLHLSLAYSWQRREIMKHVYTWCRFSFSTTGTVCNEATWLLFFSLSHQCRLKLWCFQHFLFVIKVHCNCLCIVFFCYSYL